MPDFLQLRAWATVLDIRDEEEFVVAFLRSHDHWATQLSDRSPLHLAARARFWHHARYIHGHVPESINVHTEELNDFEPRLRADAKPYIVVLAARGRTGPAVSLNAVGGSAVCSALSLQ